MKSILFSLAALLVLCGPVMAKECTVPDYSFEEGQTDSLWDIESTSSLVQCPVIGNPNPAFWGVTPTEGAELALLGNICGNNPVEHNMSQVLDIPLCIDKLAFDLLIDRMQGQDEDLTYSDLDYDKFKVFLNGEKIYERDLIRYEGTPPWEHIEVDISDVVSPGQSATLLFTTEENNLCQSHDGDLTCYHMGYALLDNIRFITSCNTCDTELPPTPTPIPTPSPTAVPTQTPSPAQLSSAPPEVFLPHLTGAQDGWTNILTCDNTGDGAAKFTLILYTDGGEVFRETYSIGPFGEKVLYPTALAEEAIMGRIEYSDANLSFRASYISENGGLAEFRLSDMWSKDMVFTFGNVYEGVVEWKGLALANYNSFSTDITLTAYGEDGQTLGEASDTLQPFSRTVAFHSKWFPDIETDDIKKLFITSETGAITGITISGDADNEHLVFSPALKTVLAMGDLSFVLSWSHSYDSMPQGPDIDLWVTDPYGVTLSASGDFMGLGPNPQAGVIDHDDTGGYGGDNRTSGGGGPERAYWPPLRPSAGVYTYGVRYYEGNGIAKYTIDVFVDHTLVDSRSGVLIGPSARIVVGKIDYSNSGYLFRILEPEGPRELGVQTRMKQ